MYQRAMPGLRLGGDIRVNWNAQTVSLWLLSHGVKKEVVNVVHAAGVDGRRVYEMCTETPVGGRCGGDDGPLSKEATRAIRDAGADFGYSWTLGYGPWAIPVARVGGDIRANWNPRCVTLWLRSQRISQGVAHALYAAGVDGLRLYHMFYAGHSGIMEEWVAAGVPNLGDVKAVVRACMRLEGHSWMLPYRWLRIGKIS